VGQLSDGYDKLSVILDARAYDMEHSGYRGITGVNHNGCVVL